MNKFTGRLILTLFVLESFWFTLFPQIYILELMNRFIRADNPFGHNLVLAQPQSAYINSNLKMVRVPFNCTTRFCFSRRDTLLGRVFATKQFTCGTNGKTLGDVQLIIHVFNYLSTQSIIRQ